MAHSFCTNLSKTQDGGKTPLTVETGVKPEHYPYVANALLPAIRDVLGDAATDAVLDAWGEAYWFLAEILIGKEEALYSETAA